MSIWHIGVELETPPMSSDQRFDNIGRSDRLGACALSPLIFRFCRAILLIVDYPSFWDKTRSTDSFRSVRRRSQSKRQSDCENGGQEGLLGAEIHSIEWREGGHYNAEKFGIARLPLSDRPIDEPGPTAYDLCRG